MTTIQERVTSGLHRLRRHWADPQYRNGYYLMANSASGAAFGFVFWLVVARINAGNPGAVGTGAGVVSAMTLVALLGKFGLDAGLIRFVPRAGRAGRRSLLVGSAALAVGLSVAVGLATLALLPVVAPDLLLLWSPLRAAAFTLFAVSISLTWVFDAYFTAEREARYSFYRNLVFNAVKVGAPVALVTAMPAFGIPTAWGLGAAASLVACVVFTPRLLRRAPESAEAEAAAGAGGAGSANDGEGAGVDGGAAPVADDASGEAGAGGERLPWPRILRYSGANYVVNASEYLPGLVLPILVISLAGAEANAYFYIAWTIAFIGFMASKAISQSAFAEASHAIRDMAAHLRKGLLQHALVLGPFVAFTAVAGRHILGLFSPQYAAEGYPLLVVFLGSTLFVAINNLYLTALKAREETVELVVYPLALLILTFAGAWLLLTRVGSVGVAWAWLAANAIVALRGGARLTAMTRTGTHDRLPADGVGHHSH